MMKTPVKTLRGRGLKLAPCVIGAALLCVTPSGHEALADEAVLDVRHADGRLTVHARSADPKVLLQRVGEATGLEVKLRGSAGDGVTASAVVEDLALEAALARLFRKLSQTVPVSYVLLYDEEGPRRIIAIFGRGEPGATIVARTPAKPATAQQAPEGLPPIDIDRIERDLRRRAETARKHGTPEDLIRAKLEIKLDGYDLYDKERRYILDEVMQ
jgi:hypothetical protein